MNSHGCTCIQMCIRNTDTETKLCPSGLVVGLDARERSGYENFKIQNAARLFVRTSHYIGSCTFKKRRTSDASKNKIFPPYFCRLTIHYSLHFFRFIFMFKNIRYITYQATQKKKRKRCIEVAWEKLNSLEHYHYCTLC